jgi:hypothetical protein
VLARGLRAAVYEGRVVERSFQLRLVPSLADRAYGRPIPRVCIFSLALGYECFVDSDSNWKHEIIDFDEVKGWDAYLKPKDLLFASFMLHAAQVKEQARSRCLMM